MKRSEAPSIGLFTIGIAALFLVGFLLLVVFGATTYRNTVESQTGNNETRATLSYLTAVARANDAERAVSIRDSKYGPMLIIRDGSGYALRIFCYEKDKDQGKVLWEEYGSEKRDPDLEKAQMIGETSIFTVEKEKDGLYRVTTDEGTCLLHFRSEGSDQP